MLPASVAAAAAAATQPRPAAPLRWARPDTTGWTVIDLDDHVTNPPGETIFLGVAGGNFVIHQTIPLTERLRIQSSGPTNLAWVGGEVFIDQEKLREVFEGQPVPPNTDLSINRMNGCQLEGDFRLIYLEGTLFHGRYLIEGIQVFNGFQAMPVIQNCRIVVDPVVLYEDTGQPDGLTHSDCFQSWGGVAGLRIANSTMISTFQGGMFGDGAYPDQPIAMQWGYTELHRSNYGGGRNTPEVGRGRLVNLVQNDRLVGPIILDQVYVDPRPRKWGQGDGSGADRNGSFWEGTDSVDETTGRHLWTFGQTYPSEGVWNLDANGERTETEGHVMRGRPPGGDFCSADVPGIGYRPPPQIVSEPFCVGGGSEEDHLANRPVARTATDYLNGSTFISRQWTVLSGPTAVGPLTTEPGFLTTVFTEIGTYLIQYALVTDTGTALSTMRLDVIEGRSNWMLNGTDFSTGLAEWIKSDTNPDNYTFDTTGGEARIIVSAAGSLSVRDRYSTSAKPTRVYPGEQFTIAADVRQITGTSKRARIQLRWLTESQQLGDFVDPEIYFDLNTYRTNVHHTFTVPDEGVGYVTWFLAFAEAEAGDEFRFRNAYVGDVINPNLLGGDTHFDQGTGQWQKSTNPDNFTLSWDDSPATEDADGYVGAMVWTVTTASSVGCFSSYSSGSERASVTPGQTITASIDVKQIAGTGKGCRMRVNFYDASNGSLSMDDTSLNVTLTGAFQPITKDITVPVGAVKAVLAPYVQGASVGDVFVLDNASLVVHV